TSLTQGFCVLLSSPCAHSLPAAPPSPRAHPCALPPPHRARLHRPPPHHTPRRLHHPPQCHRHQALDLLGRHAPRLRLRH
ncbi:hypothetical protein DFH08DRAFT_1085477, partial [Mycena albidolilacea]